MIFLRLVGIFFLGVAAYFAYHLFTLKLADLLFPLYLSIACLCAAGGLFFLFYSFRKPYQ